MAIPPLFIVYYQIKSLKGKFTLKEDYFQFNFSLIKDSIIYGIKGWLTIVPFVLLTSLIMNSLIDNRVVVTLCWKLFLIIIITCHLLFYL